MRKIKLTNGGHVFVDDDMFQSLKKWRWQKSQNGYAVRCGSRKDKTILMHRIIAGTPDGLCTDHINKNKLDNRRENLRSCTKAQNAINAKIQSNNISGYKGVSWSKDKKKWRSQIVFRQKAIHLGYYDDIRIAANAYNKKARELFAEFVPKAIFRPLLGSEARSSTINMR